jgi:predicted nucleotide-binding protein (sugar kinase/HSP70/actin superfamily)
LEEWLDYIDYCRKENYKVAGDYKHIIIQKITEFVQERDAGKIRKYFKDGIKYFAEEDPMEKVIECGSCYINRAVRGESILSLARATEYAHKGFAGVVNIIPFGCMPGIIVSSLLKQFRDNHPDIPTYTMVVDGSKDPGSDMRLEAFVQQCRDNIN